ncbi:glutamate decarboxylase 1-like [Leptonychotes weddellii]|uniref:Glutamate decarboxylase 1-like n=1 Tax=Leptonychotes weddellii TaxID=9713 RepID=A0A2U3XJD9_LEPWE|nr:glutamate decarboxylase 1-like [Leptonychotes weddellii]
MSHGANAGWGRDGRSEDIKGKLNPSVLFLIQTSLNFLYKKDACSFIEVNTITQYILLYQIQGYRKSADMDIGGMRASELNKEQMRKKSGHAFQSTEKNATKDVQTDNVMTNLSNAYASDLLPSKDGKDLTKCFLVQVVNILLHYIKKSFDVKGKILDFHYPHQLLEGLDGFNLELSDLPESLEQLLGDCTHTLKYGVTTGHPRFFNQLSSGLDVVGLAEEWLTAPANTNMFTYEIAPVFTVIETVLLKKMYEIIGWQETEAEGIFAPGGSIANLYGVLVARYKQYPEIKRQGMTALLCVVLFVSEQGHYSVKKAAAILGIGTDNVIEVKCDESLYPDPHPNSPCNVQSPHPRRQPASPALEGRLCLEHPQPTGVRGRAQAAPRMPRPPGYVVRGLHPPPGAGAP